MPTLQCLLNTAQQVEQATGACRTTNGDLRMSGKGVTRAPSGMPLLLEE